MNLNLFLGKSILVLLLSVLVVSCEKKPVTVQPSRQNITESVYASGVIKGRNQYQVYSNVTALVEKVLISEGDLVKKGTPIIKLVNKIAKLNEENAGLSAEFASLPSNVERLDELKNTIDLAKLKMENDKSLLARQQNLWAQKIGTRNEYELRELNYKIAVSAYETARLRYAETVKQLRFQEQQSRKNLQIITASASEYIIRSEHNGRVYNILKETGEMVTPQNAVATIGDQQFFLIELQVDEYDIAKVKAGQDVVLTMDSFEGQVFEARIRRIIPYMNERSKSFTVEADFLNEPPTLYPNLTCEANIVITQKNKTLTIPRDYLLEGEFVLLEKNKKRKVITGLIDYERVEIVDGLKGNEKLVKPNP